MQAWANETAGRSLPRCVAGLLLLATACAANGPAGNQADVADRNEAATRLPGSSDPKAGQQYYPVENYRKYPPQVRELIRRFDMEHGRCRSALPDERENDRACNRRHRIMVELEQRGWCWGQGDVELPFSADDYWLPCVEDPTYRPGQLGETPFPEAE